MIHSIYRAATTLGGPLIRVYLERRMARGKEDPERFTERMGRAILPRPDGVVVWLHAASVGESLSLLPLVERLVSRPGVSLVMTTGTVTSAQLMAERLPPGAIHQYVPVDRPAFVRSFLSHWQPDLALWAESEFWPNLLAETQARGIPLVLIQGRISPRSYRGWKRVPGFIRTLLSRFDLCLGQTPEDVARLKDLGAAEALCLGNLKMAVPPLPCDEDQLAALRLAIGARPLWLAASTHAGEEALCARVHRRIAKNHPGLLTVIVPRHSHRGPEIAAELSAQGLPAALRSAGQPPDGAVYVADTMGELGLFYRLSPIAFVGKSLGASGGQNPFEPALMGAAVLFGPHMENFPGMAPAMLEAGVAQEVADEAGLAEAVGKLLSDPEMLRKRRAAASAWAQDQTHALDAVTQAVLPFLAQAEARHASP